MTGLTCERLTLREMTDADLDDLTAMLGDERMMTHYARPYTRAEAQRWIDWNRGLYRDHGFGLWIVELRATGEFLGDCGITIQTLDDGTEEYEIGYHVVTAHQGRGYATEAAALCRDLARDRFGITRLTALIAPSNLDSQRVAERLGMTLERRGSVKGRECLVYAMPLRPDTRL